MSLDTLGKRILSILFSLDFAGASVLALILGFILPPHIDNAFAKDIYNIGISVLSIVFAVFFAALAIIISASDNEFVRFLEKFKGYTRIVFTFCFTLSLLFCALLCSVGFYALTANWITHKCVLQSKWWIVMFTYLFSYGLFAAFQSTQDALRYAHYRAKFLSPPTTNTAPPEQNRSE